MLPHPGGRRAVDAAWRDRQFGEGSLHFQRAETLGIHLDDGLTRLEMRILQHFRRTIDPSARDRICDHQRINLLHRQSPGPDIHQLIKFELMLSPRQVAGIAPIMNSPSRQR